MDRRISNFDQVASVRRYVLCDGAQKGIEVIDCDNGNIRFLLNVSKACDVMQLYHEGQNVSFVSKNGFSKRELSFLNRFEGGMIYTCGLDSVGDREGYDVHGSFHSAPAKVLCARCDEQGIYVEAEIKSTALFGKNLKLIRRFFTAIGSDCVQMKDTLVNEGYKDEEYALLYHVNLGYPFIGEGTQIEVDVSRCFPRTAWSKERENDMRVLSAPVDNEQETCYFLTVDNAQMSVVNKQGKRFTIAYSRDTLPCFVLWKSMASGDYAVGLEPSTTALDDQFAYKKIAPNQSVDFWLSVTIDKD